MKKHTSLLCALIAATAAMALLAGGASARNISTSSQQLRAVWNPLIVTEPGGASVRCPLTLEGSFHSSTLAKVNYSLTGYITSGSLGAPGSCTGGEGTLLTETLPWHTRYFGFTGTLPNISTISILVSGAAVRIRLPTGTCLFVARESTAEHILGTLNRNVTTQELTSITAGGEITSNEACAFGLRIRARISGTSTSFTVLNTNNRITVRLI
ncbi:MAG TPA: hypothetical protein VF250_01070 [Conexibacter sp.]